jgi:hypothetical protein
VTTVNSGETTLSRATRVLEVFGPEASSLTASDISRRTGIPMASTHRLVGQMVQLGLLQSPIIPVRGHGHWLAPARCPRSLVVRGRGQPWRATVSASPVYIIGASGIRG